MSVVNDQVIHGFTPSERGTSTGLALAATALLWCTLVVSLNVPRALSDKNIDPIIVVESLRLEPEVKPVPSPEHVPEKQAWHPQKADRHPTPEPAPIELATAPPPIVPLMPPEGPPQLARSTVDGSGKGQGTGTLAGQGRLSAQDSNVATAATWAVVPDDQFFATVYPERARQLRVGGSATIRCELSWNRHVRNCRLIGEKPKGYGFGRAVLAASRNFVINPPKLNGEVVRNSPIDIRLEFKPG